jgi:hypothetical protein
MMARIFWFTVTVLMAISFAVGIHGMLQEWNVYSPNRPQPIRATHNRIRRPVNIAKLPELLRKA